MSLYNLFSSAISRIRRGSFGTPIPTQMQVDQTTGEVTPVEGGTTTDPGVQTFVNELVGALSPTGPISLPGPFQLIKPRNSPAIQIFEPDPIPGQAAPAKSIFLQYVLRSGKVVNVYSDGSIALAFNPGMNPAGTQNNPAADTNVNVSNQVVSGPGQTSGYTGSLTVMTNASVSGCSILGTTMVMTFENGNVISVK